jgi:[ribosomal protein S5]-alanine N-acetyltransferase
VRLVMPDGFVVRSYRADDKAAILHHANNPRVTANLTHMFPNPYTAEDADRWLARVLDQTPETLFVIADADDLFVGAVGLHLGEGVYRCGAEVGYWLGEPLWGRGLATAAVGALVDWAFARFPGLERIQGRVFSWNPASARVLEKNGFILEGRMRNAVRKGADLLDELVYARLRSV